MQFRIRHLLYLTILIAILFAMISWLGVWTVLAKTIVLVVIAVFGMPIVIFVLAFAVSREVNKQLDVRGNRAVAVCMTIWLVCVAILIIFLSSGLFWVR